MDNAHPPQSLPRKLYDFPMDGSKSAVNFQAGTSVKTTTVEGSNMAKPPSLPPHPFDVRLGSLIRQRRQELGLSQEQLGARVGVTFQQVQKYERGTNRVSFSRLAAIAGALGCRITDLVAPLEDKSAPAVSSLQPDYLGQVGVVHLLKAYCAIPSTRQRRTLVKLVEELATANRSGIEPE